MRVDRFKTQITRTLCAQGAAIFCVSMLWFFFDHVGALAAASAGVLIVASNGCFVLGVFRRFEDRSAQQVLVFLYLNEIFKLFGCAVVAVWILRLHHGHVLSVAAGVLTAYLIVAPVAMYQQIKMVKR